MVNAPPRPLYPCGRALVPIVKESGWASGPDWTDMEKRKISCSHRDSNTDRTSRSESLYGPPNRYEGFSKTRISATQIL